MVLVGNQDITTCSNLYGTAFHKYNKFLLADTTARTCNYTIHS